VNNIDSHALDSHKVQRFLNKIEIMKKTLALS